MPKVITMIRKKENGINHCAGMGGAAADSPSSRSLPVVCHQCQIGGPNPNSFKAVDLVMTWLSTIPGDSATLDIQTPV